MCIIRPVYRSTNYFVKSTSEDKDFTDTLGDGLGHMGQSVLPVRGAAPVAPWCFRSRSSQKERSLASRALPAIDNSETTVRSSGSAAQSIAAPRSTQAQQEAVPSTTGQANCEEACASGRTTWESDTELYLQHLQSSHLAGWLGGIISAGSW